MKVLFAAGGTGGHVNPALSVAQELRSRYPDAEILFVGTKDKIEATLVPKAGFDFKSINISGFQRSFAPSDIIYNLRTLKKLLFVTSQCKKIIKEFSPDVAVGFGGYVSGPVIRAAHKMGVKTAVHEQNAFPGKTNIALSKYADKVMLTAKEAEKYLKCTEPPVVTGLPVREEILTEEKVSARKALGFPQEKTVILSTGGSLGAQAINEVMCDVIKEFNGKDIIFVHGYGQNGRWMPDKLKEAGIELENNDNLFVNEYIYDMAKYMASADLVISRAGASSLAEIQALGKASFLVPYPYASENHQYHNALALVNKNAAMVCEQKDLTSEKIISVIYDVFSDKEKYIKMGANARHMAICDAKRNICDIVLSLI
ncbi:MAG: undecaprenyldiphospho-muramoylpentapeptide beta-N-acetylglucosaminyltransferase [Clostridia bacterium]|nr:undecaprenyldiphospho-muramoylpentapeptide beta-N-acetylglucosaminyltransferase [Clostridia bacterium]